MSHQSEKKELERRKLSYDKWIEKSIQSFGEVFNYTKAKEEYETQAKPLVHIKCDKHNYEFLVSPKNHLRRKFGGCEECERESVAAQTSEYNVYWKEKPCNGIVYLLSSKTEKKAYVGLTRRPLQTRMDSHKKQAAKTPGTEGSLQKAINAFGMDDFTVETLGHADTLGELSRKEKHYIEYYDTLKPKGYNNNRGGSVARGIEAFNFEGQVYWGLADLADDYGIQEETLRHRVKAGWTIRQSVELDPRPIVTLAGDEWIVGGKVFISAQALCDYFGVINATFKARLKRNWTLEEAIGLDEPPNQIEYKGKTYKSIPEICDAYSQNYGRVTSRIAQGQTLEQALNPKENPKRFGKINITIDGKNFDSKTAAAKFYKMTTGKLELRLEYLNEEQTIAKFKDLEKRTHRHKGRDLTVEGITYTSFAALEKAYGVNKDTIRHRLDVGKPLEEAVGLTGKKNQFPLEFKGRIFKSETEIAKHYKIKCATFAYRLNKAGWNLEEAVGLKQRSPIGKKVIVEGKTFSSHAAAAQHYQIDIMLFRSRIERGWSLEEALGIRTRTTIGGGRKLYVVMCPDGTEVLTPNLTAFSRDKGWASDSNLTMTLTSDKHHTYHGHSLRFATDEELQNFIKENPDALAPRSGYVRNKLVKYQGKTYKSRSAFCKKFKIPLTSFTRGVLLYGTVEEFMKERARKSE
jgi:hypothetical protein